MASSNGPNGQDAVDLVINRVLSAEREARDEVQLCHAEAARILAAAEEGARRVAQRAERRAGMASRIADRTVERALQQLSSSEVGGESPAPRASMNDLLGWAVDELVEEILSAAP